MIFFIPRSGRSKVYGRFFMGVMLLLIQVVSEQRICIQRLVSKLIATPRCATAGRFFSAYFHHHDIIALVGIGTHVACSVLCGGNKIRVCINSHKMKPACLSCFRQFTKAIWTYKPGCEQACITTGCSAGCCNGR